MGRLAGAGGGRLPAPVRGPQPHAPGRLRDRRSHGDAGRHRPPGAHRRRHRGRDRARPGGAGDRAAPRAEVYELALRAGHFGLVVGSLASQTTWPTVAAWTRWRAGEGELPASVKPAHAIEHADDPPDVGTRLGVGLGLVAGVGAGLARSLAGAASRTVGGARVLAEELRGELPRLARLGRLAPTPGYRSGCCLTSRPATRPRPTSSCSRTAPTVTRTPIAASTTSSAGCSRSASARASTSAF